MSAAGPEWSGNLAFGPWWLLYSGPIGPTEPHAHHAFQIVVHNGGACVAGNHETVLSGPVVVIDPDTVHAFIDRRDHVLVAFIEPECNAGESLRNRELAVSPPSDMRLVFNLVDALRPSNWSRAEEAVRQILAMLCDAPITPMSWWRHPSVDAALHRLPALVDEGNVDVGRLAQEVGLSTSRLSHIFSEEIGVPIRSYARWMRLVNAVEHLASGQTITAAAHNAGFADAAHFTRTFRAMFGLSPTEAVGLGTWLRP